MGKYRISDDAEADIDEILVYIADDSVEAALALFSKFVDCFEMLANWNESGRVRTELADSLRSFPIGSYLIFYEIRGREVFIVRVLHGTRDIETIFDWEN